ncbi:type III pantothenate kinase [Methylocaldum szegediense]|uniref:Type III pantothenate kinase n=1 Tax=Methylocaldum szegediense TaxID=73780 RepID=A0ABM9I6E1_9GAMM|nr:type III pantothenate kinase [Methylocaldum szegediense]CAI8921804.1 Type III pantothenate kinase [Methylocaldum szegediense]
MSLLVDIGNSRVKWGIVQDDRIVSGQPFPSAAESLEKSLSHYWLSLPVPHRIYACNVAGSNAEQIITAWTQRYWGNAPHFVRSAERSYGVLNGYEEPEKLGVDRWVSLIALRMLARGPACVVDCGTALTFDVLDADGRHLGGLIAPGLAMMKQSLVRDTKGIRDIDCSDSRFFGRNTAAAVKGGVLAACTGLIERSVREAAKELGQMPELVLTGGDANEVADTLEAPCTVVPDLILRGLLRIARSVS